MIPVTKPFLPPIEEVFSLYQDIWKRQWLTNNGPLVNELELKVKELLDVPHMLYLTNGTIAIQIAIKALKLKGEIITTPFSYVATSSSIMWEGCVPVFVDIDEHTFNINPALIESAITEKTTAILATHVFGNPCDIAAIEVIAKKHQLKVIYDAAHCFGTFYKGKSVFAFGDISTTSFHATKIFHTVEGGAVFTPQPELLKIMAHLRNFGHDGPESFVEIGINGKNSEFHAAMGLVNLKHWTEIRNKRSAVIEHYDKWMTRPEIQKQQVTQDAELNYAYYPVVFKSEEITLKVIESLNAHWIHPRRYFYPSLNDVSLFNPNECPVSSSIAKRVLCLPLYHDLTDSEIDFISRIVVRSLNY